MTSKFKGDVRFFSQESQLPHRYIYARKWIYYIECDESEFYTFLKINKEKWFSISEWLEILEMSWKIKFIW